MKYLKSFEVRWSDVDANKHLANAAYLNFMSHTRISFLSQYGFDLGVLKKQALAPVVFYEHIYYFKESFLGDTLKVSLEITGLSKDGMFFSFDHNFYSPSGKHLAHCQILGAWMDATTRKLTPLPDRLIQQFPEQYYSLDFKTLTKADTRIFAKTPKDLT